MAGKHSRGESTASVASAHSLMQDVPGAFPEPTTQPRSGSDNEEEQYVEVGDNEVTFRSLSQAIYARRAEYVRSKHVRIKIGTWNVAACKGVEKDVGGWFVGGMGVAEKLTGVNVRERQPGIDVEGVAEQEARYERKQPTLPLGDSSTLPAHGDVGLYVLALQEVIDITAVTPAFMPTDPAAALRWKTAMQEALPESYTLVAEQQLLGLLLLIYASPDVAKETTCVSTTSVGTGLGGFMGNKGAVTARLVLGETTRLVFVNSHLAAGADKGALERRNWDAQQIVQRTKFEPIQDVMDLQQTNGETIGDEDFAFWCGDLNYRLEGVPGEDIRRILMLHTRNEYDLSQPSANKIEHEVAHATEALHERLSLDESDERPSTLADEIAASDDPASLQATLNSLLPHDELQQQIRARKAFYDGWREGQITFLPTYKYDIGSVGVFDSSEKKRAPSWCDRIIYRTRKDKMAYDAKIRDEEAAKKKDAEMTASGIDQAGNDEDLLYDYNPEADGGNAGDYDEYDDNEDAAEEDSEAVIVTKEGFRDEITQEYYTAHQRVLSSDHKPLDASFMLKYDAVVPELKAKIHAEVVRELDKAENEGRPNVTVVVDKATHTSPAMSDENLPLGKSDEGVWFGDVRYGHYKQRFLTVANTSRVPSTFCFMERPVDSSQAAGIAPRWLTIKINEKVISSAAEHSEQITLEPGDTATVELELRIKDTDDVRFLNDNSRSDIEDILVLRVENGRDHFIPIRGRWLESSLGRTIDQLIRIPEGGIRKLQGQKPSDSTKEKVKKAISAVAAATTFSSDLNRSPSAASTTSSSKAESATDDESDAHPVRFSAPRELFRLTEAIEGLSTRVVAEWEMTHDTRNVGTPSATPTTSSSSTGSDKDFINVRSASIEPARAPWDEHPAWPFDSACWTMQSRSPDQWHTALSDACTALDSDEPLDPSISSAFSRDQRLYVLCNLLIIFLASMPDGIVTGELWPSIETYLSDNEKTKRNKSLSIDDQRTAIQELLSHHSPSHGISFILITSMLERMVQESSRAHEEAEAQQQEVPMSPGKKTLGGLKRIATFGAKATETRTKAKDWKEKRNQALAAVFAKVVVRNSAERVSSEKARKETERRKAEMLEVFLRRDG